MNNKYAMFVSLSVINHYHSSHCLLAGLLPVKLPPSCCYDIVILCGVTGYSGLRAGGHGGGGASLLA